MEYSEIGAIRNHEPPNKFNRRMKILEQSKARAITKRGHSCESRKLIVEAYNCNEFMIARLFTNRKDQKRKRLTAAKVSEEDE